jgi:hypothetical protein
MNDINFASPARVFGCWPLEITRTAVGAFVFGIIAANTAAAEDYFALFFKFFESISKVWHTVYNAGNFGRTAFRALSF